MKNFALASVVAVAVMAPSAQAADTDLGLIVSGVVDSWAGVQIIDGPSIDGGSDSETLFTNGGEGLLSFPLGENMSVQSDVKYEYNSNAFESSGDIIGPRYSYQGAVHFSWRDPSAGLFGVFGGVGTSDFGAQDTNARFVGGEAQFYADDLTFYVQGGYVDFDPEVSGGRIGPVIGFGLDEGFFARGVVRWFPTAESRLQLEGTYLNADFVTSPFDDMEAFSVKARYDFTLAGMPVIGDVPIYVAYRGTFRDGCFQEDDFGFGSSTGIDDHTIMIGTSYSFSGDRLMVDRRGATLDTPDFNHSCFGGQFVDGGGQTTGP